MELIGIIFVIAFLWGIISPILRGLGAGVKAASQAATGKGTFSENFKNEFVGMGPAEARAVEFTTDLDDGEKLTGISIELKGLFPNQMRMDMNISTSIYTKSSDGKWTPLLSSIEQWQEESTTAYLDQRELKSVEPDMGFKNWVRVATLFPAAVTPAHSGKQETYVVVRFMRATGAVSYGLPSPSSAVIREVSCKTFVYYKSRGYEEAREAKQKIKPDMIALAVSMAMADGSFDASEGNVIKHWIQKQVASSIESDKEKIKSLCNEALKRSYADALAGKLSMSAPISSMNQHADDSDKFEAIELCMDVMAADGTADQSEMDLIWKITKSLKIDREEVEKIKDRKILNLDVDSNSDASSVEALLGMDPAWTDKEKRDFLRKEFSKWNSRIHGIADPAEKEKAQRMLDLISEARKSLA